MRKKVFLILTLMMVVPVVLLTVSCSKQMVQNTPEAVTHEEAPAASVKSETEPQQNNDSVELNNPDAIESEFFGEAIYFEYDSSELSDGVLSLLTNMADYMSSNPRLKLKLEGHCDDRGTATYNMALGKRRAESVKTFLISLGIPDNRLDTISYGKSQPAVIGHNEVAWAKNRRVKFATHRL